MSTYRLDRLINPKAVAVIGGSPRAKSLGLIVLRNLQAAGFQGNIDVVNPYHGEIGGQRTFAALKDLPATPDLAIVTAPAKEVPGIIEECGRRGVASAVVISSGLGHGSGSLAEKALASARRYGVRIVGPNGLGVIAPAARLNASFAARMPEAGELAVISQSGAVAAAIGEWASRRRVGFSAVVSLGDALDVDFGDTLDYFALDTGTRAILLYMESVSDAPKFMAAARAAARTKPVVVVKSGRFAQGARAAATHTGALAGSDAVYDAAFRRAGLLRAFDLDELFGAAETLSHVRPFPGRRLAIMTNGGGVGVLAVDQLVALGGTLADLSAETKTALSRFLPPTWSHANPVDIIGDADADRYRQSFETLLNDDESDALLIINVPTALASPTESARAIIEVIAKRRSRGERLKPVFAVWLGGDPVAADMFSCIGVPHYADEAEAVAGFMQMVSYSEAVEALTVTPPSIPGEFAADIETARMSVRTAVAAERKWLNPPEISQLMRAYGIPVNPVILAAGADEAASVAAPLLKEHGAVVVKVLSPDVVHKSEVGGVALNLRSTEAVRSATSEMLARVVTAVPAARITGVTVSPMITRPNARELIAGIADDPTFGPVIAFGAGGVAVEVTNDKALALPPLDLKLARDLVARPRIARLLDGYRHVPAADRDAIALTLVKLSQLVADIPEVREIDLNPLLVDEKGVLTVDARVAVSAADQEAGKSNARMAIRPYPKEWERAVILNDGGKIALRPVRPEDEPAFAVFLNKVSIDGLRLRLPAGRSNANGRLAARFTQIDYAREMTLIALQEATGLIEAMIRLQVRAYGKLGEFTMLLGAENSLELTPPMMHLMVDYAKAQRIARIEGLVPSESALEMFCEEFGFSPQPRTEGKGITRFALDIGD